MQEFDVSSFKRIHQIIDQLITLFISVSIFQSHGHTFSVIHDMDQLGARNMVPSKYVYH